MLEKLFNKHSQQEQDVVTTNGKKFFKKTKTILLKQLSCNSNGIGKKQIANGPPLQE